MPTIGLWEMVLVGALALFVIGPEGLPNATRQLGKLYGQVRRMADDLRRALVLEADRLDEEERLRELRRRRVEAEEARLRQEIEAGELAPHSQPPPDAAGLRARGVPSSDEDEASRVPVAGFTQEEWDELPRHVRDVLRHRTTT